MLCQRCQSDNKPERHSCWNCLAPLEGPLAQSYSRRPPDISSDGSTAPAAKKEGQGFWFLMFGLAFALVVASMLFFWSSNANLTKDWPKEALPQQAAPPPPPPDTSASSTTTAGTTAGTAGGTAGATTTGGATAAGTTGSSDESGTGGLAARNKALNDPGQ